MTVCLIGIVIALVGNLLWLNALERRVVKHQQVMDSTLELAKAIKERQADRIDLVKFLEAKVDAIPADFEKRIKPLENQVHNLGNFQRLVENTFGAIGRN